MTKNLDTGGRTRLGAVLLMLLGVSVVGCNSLLDVDNPNNVIGDDILVASAAQALANGSLYGVQNGYSYSLLVYSQVSDELQWIGSRDGYYRLDQGWAEFALNEFFDAAWDRLAPARWMADEAISIMEMHLAGDTLPQESSLAEAYLWGALEYVTIADMWDDFTFSDMQAPAPPIGEANMGGLYTTAIGYMNSGLALDITSGLERNLTAMRARAKHAQGVWNLIGTRPISTAGLISAADASTAATDAAAALAIDPSDWTFYFEYPSGTASNYIASAINSRKEQRWGNRYIVATADDQDRNIAAANRGITLMDPVDNVADMRLDAFMTMFEDEYTRASLPMLSGREMHLILAEDALVRGDDAAFSTHINVPRAWGGLSDWTAGSGVSQLDILIYERQVNLFLQGRRLNDMYRFGIKSDNWDPTSTAYSNPGQFFPISKGEIDSNCYINPDWPADIPCPPTGS